MCVCYWLQNPQCLQPWHRLCVCVYVWAHMPQPIWTSRGQCAYMFLKTSRLRWGRKQRRKQKCFDGWCWGEGRTENNKSENRTEWNRRVMGRGGADTEAAEDWLITLCSGTATWSAPALTAAGLNPLNSLRARRKSMPFCLHIHTHSHSRRLLGRLSLNIIPL